MNNVKDSALSKLLKTYIEDYKEVARKRATEFLESKLKDMEEVNWDLDAIAPYPSTVKRNYIGDYKTALAKHKLYHNITTYVKPTRMMGEPNLRKRDPKIEERFIKMNVDAAENSYLSFIAKMEKKVGKEIKEADIDGSIWTNAFLTVTTVDGEIQKWKTQMIINFSKYNKIFNQFPTRRIKG